jgi:hypothetical protein
MTHTEALKLALGRLEWFVDSYPHDIAVSKEEFMRPFKEALAKQSVSVGEPDDLMIAYMSGLHDGKKLAQSRSDVKKEQSTECVEQSVSVGEPVAHCEAGPEYCWKCHEEMKPTYGSEEIRKLREVNKRLADHIPDAKKMVEALREIGDFAHDRSTGPTVPDALWEIRSIAYNAIVEFELMMNIATPYVPTGRQQRKPLTDEQITKIWEKRPYFNDFARAIEAKLKEKNT